MSKRRRRTGNRAKYLGGIVPFGFTVGEDGSLAPTEAEQAILADTRTAHAAKTPLRSICADVLSKHGRKISLGAVHRIVHEG